MTRAITIIGDLPVTIAGAYLACIFGRLPFAMHEHPQIDEPSSTTRQKLMSPAQASQQVLEREAIAI